MVRELLTEEDLQSTPTRAHSFQVLLIAVLCVPLLGAIDLPAGQSTLPILTNATQIRELTPRQAELGYPVRLRAIVTYFHDDRTGPDLFVQDSSAGIWVDLGTSTRHSFKAGQLVEIEGVSSEPDFAPEISKPRIKILGEVPLPRAKRVSFAQIASGGEDSQWVEVEGIVHSAAIDQGRLTLVVTLNGGRVTVRVPDFQSVPVGLVDSKVRLHGACGAIFNRRNQLIGVTLYVPSFGQVEIKERGPDDPFSMPLQPIDTLLRFTPKGASGHRVRVEGVVSYQHAGQSLFIRDDTQGLYIQTDQKTLARPGDRVEVLGFPSAGAYSPVLVDSVFRTLSSGAEPAPIKVTAEQTMLGTYDAEVIRIEARLKDQEQARGGKVLILQAGNVVFDAQVPESKPQQPWPQFINGSRLELTGVCSVDVDEARTVRAFRLLLRSPKDIVMLERPPWWTLKQAAWTLGIMAIAMLAAMAWVWILRRRVSAQTGIILERLQREIVLEERYRDLFENATDIVYTHDLAGTITSLNRAGELSTGYERHKALEMNMDQLLAPEYRDLARQMIQAKITSRKTTTYELEIVAKDGRRVPLEVSTRLIYQHGKPVGVQGNARDITERKWTASLLEGERRVLEMVASDAPLRDVLDSICQLLEQQAPALSGFIRLPIPQSSGLCLAAAPSVTGNKSGSNEPNAGTGAESGSTPAYRGGHVVLLDAADDRPRVEDDNPPGSHPSGASRAKCTTISSTGGKILGTLEIRSSQPFSTGPREQQIIERAVSLARIAIERTQATEALAEQARELARSNSELEQFAYVASHDLQEPLRMVTSFTQLLEEDCRGRLTPDAEEYIAYVTDAAKRMRTLINDLLAYARVGSRSKDLEPTNCEEAVDRAIANLRAGIEESGGSVTRDVLPLLMADASQLVQLFQNLIGNAIKYRGEKSPQIHISAQGKAGDWVFSVRDNGIGISPQHAERIFVIFQRLHTRKEYPGTGIGLAVCKKIVERHRGRIWVESQPGEGSTFCFTLPRDPNLEFRHDNAGHPLHTEVAA